MNPSTSVPRIGFFASRPISRLGRAARALAGLNRDPNRLDLVFVLGEAVNRRALPAMWSAFVRDADGARVVADEPSIDSAHVDFDALAALPDGTLGREYVRFLRDNGITPDVFRAPEGIDPRAAFVAKRVRQTHDLWHVITGYLPDVRGEVLLQAFTFAQIGIPSAALIALIGLVRGTQRLGPTFARDVAAAYQRGHRARAFAPFYWEEHWADSLASLRDRLGCVALPAAA